MKPRESLKRFFTSAKAAANSITLELKKFRKAKRTIVALAFFFTATLVTSFHDDILHPRRTNEPALTVTEREQERKSERWWELSEKLLMTICALLIMHLLDQVYLMGEITKNTRTVLNEVVGKHFHLVAAADGSGIADIYVDRFDAKKNITEDIMKERNRIWLLGVVMHVQINAKDLLLTLRDKQKEGVDVRILMLDAFRSTAVFRSFLESEGWQVERIVNYYERLLNGEATDPTEANGYFDTDLCNEFESSFRALRRIPELEPCIKFYAHTPACWLVMFKDKVYFQPYTFGNPPIARDHSSRTTRDSHNNDQTIGDLMPVFKFRLHKNVKTFKVLEDHFLKLWATSDCSLLHMNGRQDNKGDIIKSIFATRKEWLRHVYNMLHTDRGRESYDKKPGQTISDEKGEEHRFRKYERQICPEPVPITFKINPEENGNQDKSFIGAILDSSRNGLAIRASDVEVTKQGRELPGKQISVSLDSNCPVDPPRSNKLTEFFEKIFLATDNKFEIRYVDAIKKTDHVRIGLQKLR